MEVIIDRAEVSITFRHIKVQTWNRYDLGEVFAK